MQVIAAVAEFERGLLIERTAPRARVNERLVGQTVVD